MPLFGIPSWFESYPFAKLLTARYTLLIPYSYPTHTLLIPYTSLVGSLVFWGRKPLLKPTSSVRTLRCELLQAGAAVQYGLNLRVFRRAVGTSWEVRGEMTTHQKVPSSRTLIFALVGRGCCSCGHPLRLALLPAVLVVRVADVAAPTSGERVAEGRVVARLLFYGLLWGLGCRSPRRP
jgi:hypothetical protein